jgi:hypothetical protein
LQELRATRSGGKTGRLVKSKISKDQEEVLREIGRRSEGQKMGRRRAMKERERAMGDGCPL